MADNKTNVKKTNEKVVRNSRGTVQNSAKVFERNKPQPEGVKPSVSKNQDSKTQQTFFNKLKELVRYSLNLYGLTARFYEKEGNLEKATELYAEAIFSYLSKGYGKFARRAFNDLNPEMQEQVLKLLEGQAYIMRNPITYKFIATIWKERNNIEKATEYYVESIFSYLSHGYSTFARRAFNDLNPEMQEQVLKLLEEQADKMRHHALYEVIATLQKEKNNIDKKSN